ncbi:MAG TPA: TOBE domain-containing protein [Kofleriaceae bacterium]|nr:TOBE domain-containing protein [Kofleriaceae bacterium]
MMNVYDVVVLSCGARDSHAWLRVGRSRLAVRRWAGMGKGKRARASIRPEDVVLCADPPGRVSARNVLPGFVRGVRSSPDGVFVTTDVGFLLTALVTRGAVEELGLRRGVPVFAVVKANAIAPQTDVSPRFAVSVTGAAGDIEPRQLAFLRLIESKGSMLGAAREAGISYRTAWLWVRNANRIWGRRLVDRTHGGRGGGGAALTPEGRAILRRAAEVEQQINASPSGGR